MKNKKFKEANVSTPAVVEESCTIVDDKGTEEPLNKSDSETIIDPGKEELPPKEPVNDVSSNAIVIIDDDVKKTDNEPVNAETPIIEIPKTSLEQLIYWLHNDAPLSNTELTDLSITMEDFALALKCVQPSAKREGFATVPDVTWDDVGSLRDIREELQMTILVFHYVFLPIFTFIHIFYFF